MDKHFLTFFSPESSSFWRAQMDDPEGRPLRRAPCTATLVAQRYTPAMTFLDINASSCSGLNRCASRLAIITLPAQTASV
jgi:hypothetical protein